MKEWLKYWYSEYRQLNFFPRKLVQFVILWIAMALIYTIFF